MADFLRQIAAISECAAGADVAARLQNCPDMPPSAVVRALDPRLPTSDAATSAAFWSNSVPELLTALQSARLLSLDVFDTLLLRATAHPHDVHLEVGRRAVRRGWMPRHVTPESFRTVRVNAERRARLARNNNGPAEVTLEEIWAAMPPLVRCDPREGAALEVEVESEVCYVNPAIWQVVEAARLRDLPMALVSDMYVSPAQLRSIAEGAGCALDPFDAVLVSSERRGAKWDGTMFARLAERFPEVPASAILHVGDNAASDVARAREAGLGAAHYDVAHRLTDEVERLERALHGANVGELAALRRLAARTAAGQPEGLRWWHELGAVVLGPFLAAFADWVVDECASDGITVVRPVMREGALCADVIAASASARGVSLDVAPLYVSRAATFLPGLDAIDDDVIADLSSRPHVTRDEALALLELPPSAGPESLGEILQRQSVREAAERQRRAARERFVRFVRAQVGDAPDVALVDIGFHGTIGLAIERATRQHAGTRWHQFLAVGADSLELAWTNGSDVRAFAGGPGTHAEAVPELIRHAAVLEALLVTGPTTCGYAEEHGTVRARTEPLRGTARQDAFRVACRAGVLAFQQAWLSLRRSKPALAARIASERNRFVQQLHRLVVRPTAAEAAHIGALEHEHNGGGTAAEPLCDVGGVPSDVDAPTFLRATSGGAHAYGRRWLWPQGVVQQKWPGYLAVGDGAASAPGELPALAELAQRVREAGLARCLVYGAGDAGRALAVSLRVRGVTVAGFVDRSERLQGTCVEGVPVQRPSAALAGDCHAYAVGSLAFAEQIAADLQKLYEARPEVLRLFVSSAPEAFS
jgi:FMN phosphatase YigB (HAD superfamily)